MVKVTTDAGDIYYNHETGDLNIDISHAPSDNEKAVVITSLTDIILLLIQNSIETQAKIEHLEKQVLELQKVNEEE